MNFSSFVSGVNFSFFLPRLTTEKSTSAMASAAEESEVTASLIKHHRTTLERIEKFISDKYFTDVNLYGRLYPETQPIGKITHWKIPEDGAEAWQKWKFEDIVKQSFSEVKVGDTFGPSWTTHWFKLEFEIPEEYKNKEVRLRWMSQSEAMVWSATGEPLQGLSTGVFYQMRSDFLLTKQHIPDSQTKVYYIEMVCSTMFGNGKGGMINPPNPKAMFTLEKVEISTFDTKVYGLIRDLEALHGLAKEMPEDERGFRALYAGNQMINDIISGKVDNAVNIAKDFFKNGNGSMALTLALIGNCHIDSAWLWPFSETKRKAARSWSSTIRLMDDYPEMVFACSQAQQFFWVKEHFPAIYDKMKVKIAEKKFIPVGATWVEMDGLMPSGESFIRQFMYGQKFYEEEFGFRCREFWLPDTFGYSGQIPQICQHFDISRFLSQKLSWSLVNKFPNHTFMWEGIDGSTVLAHFPPGDSYGMNMKVKEAKKTETNLRDKGRVNTAGFLYGYGDGGGGPTQDMLERARRLQNVDGCPKMVHMTPNEMFERMEKEKRNISRWVGELYLELHNGTYTSQAFTKLMNRRCEFELRKCELLLAMVASLNLNKKDNLNKQRSVCEEAWKKVLLNQFHDVIPGSSIGLVYVNSDQLYKETLESAAEITNTCIKNLSKAKRNDNKSLADAPFSVLNTWPWTVQKVLAMNENKNEAKKYVAVEVPPLSFSSVAPGSNKEEIVPEFPLANNKATIIKPPPVKISKKDSFYEIENQFIFASISFYGQILKLVDKKSSTFRDIFEKKDLEKGYGNLLTLYDDVPLFWDAWDVMDYHLETGQVLNSEKNKSRISQLTLINEDPLRVELEWAVEISKSSLLRQKIILTAVDPFLTFDNVITWNEAHKFLKAEFDTGILAREATFDIQFGHLKRPTHFNTSWDSAKFETCGHKWADLSEYDCGLSVLSCCKYGWSSRGGKLCLSLLRAPKVPDDKCDMGEHQFAYAAMPHQGTFQEARTIQASCEFNSPLTVRQEMPISNIGWLKLDGEGVMIDAIKLTENSTDEIIVRLHEMFGSSRSVRLKVGKNIQLIGAQDCNGMEEKRKDLAITSPDEDSDSFVNIPLQFSIFQIRTIKLILKPNAYSERETKPVEEEFVLV